MRFTFTSLLTVAALGLQAQTSPTAYNLANGNYSMNAWPSGSAAGTYPTNMVFHYTTDPSEPALYDVTADGAEDYDCGYAQASRNRINGRDAEGLSFIATGSAQYDDCTAGNAADTRFVGVAVLALNSTGRQGVSVQWTGGTITVGDDPATPRIFAIQLQYRIGSSGAWMAVPAGGTYTTGAIGTSSVQSSTLPATCDNQSQVQLRWAYYQTVDGNGTRPELRLDDITVSSSPTTSVGMPEFPPVSLLRSNNPSDGLFHLATPVTARIVDRMGRTVAQIEEGDMIDIRFADAGAYTLITSEGATLRLIKF